MEFRVGQVVNGIVVEDEETLEEGAHVHVMVGDANNLVAATGEDLTLIRLGQAAAARGELLDAREFLAALRAEG